MQWTEWDLNPRLPPCEGGDLPLIYRPRPARTPPPRKTLSTRRAEGARGRAARVLPQDPNPRESVVGRGGRPKPPGPCRPARVGPRAPPPRGRQPAACNTRPQVLRGPSSPPQPDPPPASAK